MKPKINILPVARKILNNPNAVLYSGNANTFRNYTKEDIDNKPIYSGVYLLFDENELMYMGYCSNLYKTINRMAYFPKLPGTRKSRMNEFLRWDECRVITTETKLMARSLLNVLANLFYAKYSTQNGVLLRVQSIICPKTVYWIGGMVGLGLLFDSKTVSVIRDYFLIHQYAKKLEYEQHIIEKIQNYGGLREKEFINYLVSN